MTRQSLRHSLYGLTCMLSSRPPRRHAFYQMSSYSCEASASTSCLWSSTIPCMACQSRTVSVRLPALWDFTFLPPKTVKNITHPHRDPCTNLQPLDICTLPQMQHASFPVPSWGILHSRYRLGDKFLYTKKNQH